MIELISNKIILNNGYEIREYYTNKGNVRALIYDECIQSIIYIDDKNKNSLVLDYFNYYNLLVDLNPAGIDCLMLGGGGISYPRYFINNYSDKNMDVVEIDKKCIDYAKKYFYLDDLLNNNGNRLNIFIDDALKYVEKCNKKYDYILIDLFDGKKPINEIYYSHYGEKIKEILNDNGVIVINYIFGFSYYNNELLKITSLFEHYKIISDEDNFNTSYNVGNIIIILSNNDINIPSKYKCKDFSYLV